MDPSAKEFNRVVAIRDTLQGVAVAASAENESATFARTCHQAAQRGRKWAQRTVLEARLAEIVGCTLCLVCLKFFVISKLCAITRN